MPSRILLFALFCLAGCTKNYLFVQQEAVDCSFLASSKVGTPDPRQEHPPIGERLLIGWDFPKSVFDEELKMVATVRLWNNLEEQYLIPLQRKRDSTFIYFPAYEKDQCILTYKIEVTNREGQIVTTWNHQFWTPLIDVDKTSSSVSSQPRHGSVIEMP